MLGHTEHTLAHITLVPVVAVKARDLGEALERLSTLRYSSPPRPRLKLEAISPPPCDVHMFSQGRPSVEQLGHSWEQPPHTCSEQLRQRVAHSVLLLVQLRHSLVELSFGCCTLVKVVYALVLG